MCLRRTVGEDVHILPFFKFAVHFFDTYILQVDESIAPYIRTYHANAP